MMGGKMSLDINISKEEISKTIHNLLHRHLLCEIKRK